MRFGLADLGGQKVAESPLDLSSAVRGPDSSLHAWQMLLKERDAMFVTSSVSPSPVTAATTTPSLALLRSFAALTEKLPQSGFESGQPNSMADSHRALSALQQVSHSNWFPQKIYSKVTAQFDLFSYLIRALTHSSFFSVVNRQELNPQPFIHNAST